MFLYFIIYNIYNCSRKNSKNKSIHKNNKINYNKFLNNSFTEIVRGNNNNIPNSSSGKNKINKKNIFIINPLKNDWEKIIENLKVQKNNKAKIEKKEIKKSTKNKNQIEKIENKNTISSTEDNNNINNINNNFSYKINKTNCNVKNIEKSYSCKNINFIPVKKQNKSSNNNNNNDNTFFTLNKNMEQKINYLNENYNNDTNKVIETVNEFFIKYCKEIEDQHQKKLIFEIFYHINNILNQKEQQISNIQKEKEDLIQQNNKLIEQNNILIQKNNILENKINNNIIISENKNDEMENSNKSSSSVNTEELESIRFFDKIIMKKHSILNIPELSFQKINGYKDNNIHKKNIKQRYSFQGNNIININNMDKKEKKMKNNINLNKRTINYYNSGIFHNSFKQKINIRYNQNNKK